MYIEDRLFSETSDEVLYSVTMTEDEYDLFSEFMERGFSSPAQKILRNNFYKKLGKFRIADDGHVTRSTAKLLRRGREYARSTTPGSGVNNSIDLKTSIGIGGPGNIVGNKLSMQEARDAKIISGNSINNSIKAKDIWKGDTEVNKSLMIENLTPGKRRELYYRRIKKGLE